MPTPEQQAVIDARDALGLQIIDREKALETELPAAPDEASATVLADALEAMKRNFAALNDQIKGFD